MTFNNISNLVSVILLWVIFTQPTYAELGERKELFKINSIEIRGIKKVESQAILEKINSKVGTNLDNYLLRKDIKKIYSMKYFENVEAHRENENKLVFIVKERPIINSIIFMGNDEVDTDDLKEQIKSKNYSILDINTLKSDVKTLQKYYEEKGFYLASINYEIKKVSDENIEVKFKIKEFDKVMVKKIIFLGNKAFEDFQLKDIMETREESLFSFMSGSGNFKDFNFQTDIERIKYFYKTKGYLQINIGSPEITVSEDRKWIFITIKLNEGPSFKVNDVSFQGELLFSEDQLLNKIKIKTDTVYSEDLLRRDIQKLTEMYQDKGYAFANVLRTLSIVPGENKVNVEFSFEKGKLAYFGRISIRGNTKTRDKVIRRELVIVEGEKFSGTDLRVSKEHVNRLGFFEPGSVIFNTITRRGQDDILDIEIQVKERNTGQLSVGAGYSTARGMFVNASISQNNFLGRGQNLAFSLTWSDTNKTFNIGFTEPYLFDTKWTAGGDIFSQNNESSSSYSYKRDGFDLRVGYPIFDYTRLFVTYKLEKTNMTQTADPTLDVELENGIASIIRTSFIRDIRNNKFEPSSGYYTSISTEYSGLGGDKYWFKVEADGRYFKKLYGDLVFRSRFYASKLSEINGKAIPRTEKFTLGGARNLRGYPYESIGPKGVYDVDGVSMEFNTGGLFSAYTTLELEHPLAREAGLKWVIFFDAGDAGTYDTFKLYSDYGFGFRWFSPIGVLRFEFGYPLNEDEDQGGQFNFDIGQLF